MFQQPENTEDLEHPVVPIIATCDGLNQESEFYYTVDDQGRRIQVDSKGAEPDGRYPGMMRRKMVMKLPLMLCPDLWIRHNYHIEDVVETLNSYRPIHLWQLAVLLGIPLSNSSVKLAFSTPSSLVFASKAIVMIKIGSYLQKYYKFSDTKVLDKTYDEHVPPLPVHRVPATVYQTWKLATPQDKNQINMLSPNHLQYLFNWKGIHLAPMWMEGDCVYMIRLVDEQTFLASGREHDSPVTRPIHFVHNGQMYCGLVDEAALFIPG